MALMPGLQINMGQQLKLTPQLQQSIKILQYSALEVQQTIETTLETNFMLEMDEGFDQEIEENEELENPEAKNNSTEKESTPADEAPLDINQSETIKDDMEVDCDWEDVYSDHTPSSSSHSSEEYASAETYTASEESLHDHLYWQSEIYPWADDESVIASYIIDDINEEGYLSSSLEDITLSISQNEPDVIVSVAEVEAVLMVIQQFEPTGVGARTVQESLLLQLATHPKTHDLVTAII